MLAVKWSVFITCLLVYVCGASRQAMPGDGTQTNAAFAARVAPVTQALAGKHWSVAARRAAQARRQLAAYRAAPLVDSLPLGFYLAFWQGAAQRRIAHQAPRAAAVLAEAAALLRQSDPRQLASNAWADLYYEQGQTYRTCGRCFDAQRFLAASAAFSAASTHMWLRAQLALVNLDLRRSRYDAAFTAMTNLWAAPALRTREAHYLYAIANLSQRRNREACDALLDGLARFGFVPRLAERDPLYRAFLDHLGRASDAQIATFYDLLRVQLETLPLEHGYEHTAALLISQRALLARCYPFLSPADDLQIVQERYTAERSMPGLVSPDSDDALLDDVALEEL